MWCTLATITVTSMITVKINYVTGNAISKTSMHSTNLFLLIISHQQVKLMGIFHLVLLHQLRISKNNILINALHPKFQVKYYIIPNL